MVKPKHVQTVPIVIASENANGATSAITHKRKSHPPVSKMVMTAIESLNEKKGSSLHAIKKYLDNIYKVDSNKLSSFIKKFIKTSVNNKLLIQTSGKGANGSFKLSALAKNPSNLKKYVIRKKTQVNTVEDNNIVDKNNNDKTIFKLKKKYENDDIEVSTVAEPSTSSVGVIKKKINTRFSKK